MVWWLVLSVVDVVCDGGSGCSCVCCKYVCWDMLLCGMLFVGLVFVWAMMLCAMVLGVPWCCVP